ncbi:hypothetical protein ANN_06306 [Periplaneta americana]|uniref:C1q domain-containing protein n=1 Tax=Periplaneta americana TaxID=6978 RepID=A0ABQ8TFH0_PERAM|nr:hypothetical protein ANN_06306 [Periplaneta americana]
MTKRDSKDKCNEHSERERQSKYLIEHCRVQEWSQGNDTPKYFPKNLILKNPQSLFLSQTESPSFTAIQNNRRIDLETQIELNPRFHEDFNMIIYQRRYYLQSESLVTDGIWREEFENLRWNYLIFALQLLGKILRWNKLVTVPNQRERMLHVLAGLLLVSLCAAAVPDPPKGVVGARKYATNLHDCNGAVAFSSAGALAPTKEDAGKLSFRSALADKGIGWSRESGEFTCFCPGLYQFAFAGSGKTAATRLSFKFPALRKTSANLQYSLNVDLCISSVSLQSSCAYDISENEGRSAYRFVLKKKPSNSDAWTTVVSTGGGGGANIALLDMEVGDQTAIWLEDGEIAPESDNAPVSTFSGVRIAKKQ